VELDVNPQGQRKKEKRWRKVIRLFSLKFDGNAVETQAKRYVASLHRHSAPLLIFPAT
jgi:hypothetical protein